jgi:hypothetical protein
LQFLSLFSSLLFIYWNLILFIYFSLFFTSFSEMPPSSHGFFFGSCDTWRVSSDTHWASRGKFSVNVYVIQLPMCTR